MRTLHLLIIVFTLVPLMWGCTKKRPDRFAQGQGINIDSIADFQDKTFWLKTGAALTPANSTKSDSLSVQSTVKGFNNFPLVEYTTNADLLGSDIPLRGKPNFTYEVRYKLTDNYLKIYKVAKKEDLPFSEWAYGETLADGRLAIPLVGYGVQGYYRIEKSRNSDNEKTHIQIEIPEKSPTNASHFKIDRLNRRIFSAIEKIDVYPADYFRGEWYYSETTIDTKVGNEMEIGGVGGVDTNLSMASRIRILLNSNSYMRGANVNIDARLDQKDDLSYEYVFNIPIVWKEFRAQRQGKETALSEEEVFERTPTRRPYIKIDFENLITTSNELSSALSIFNRILGVQKVVDVQFSPDFFSFTLLKVATGSRVKYSYLRAKTRPYKKARRHFKEDRKLYGFFTTSRRVIVDRDFQRREDFERNIFLNRFDPNQDIVFNFTTNTPQKKWIRDVGRAAIFYWNKVFEQAGAKSRVLLDESQDVALGDIRYNTLNFLHSIRGSQLNGFGPSLTDPFTGEIITATTNIHINSKLDMLAGEVRNYMRNKIGLHNYVSRTTGISLEDNQRGDQASIFMEPWFKWTGDDQPPQPMTIPTWQGPEYNRIGYQSLSGFDKDMEVSKLIKIMDGRGEMNAPWKAFNRFWALSKKFPGLSSIESRKDRPLRNATTSMVAQRIEAKCKGVNPFVEKVKNTGEIDVAQEKAIVENCVQLIAFPFLLGTTLHEMGHNLGLRHNFFASADPKQFYTPEETDRIFGHKLAQADIPGSSSVMDYPAWGEEHRYRPGKYDIAAIRFGYADAIEMKNGQPKKLNVDRSIRDNLGGQLAGMTRHKFCTDEDAMLLIDPMCTRWDKGSTPDEVVDYIIESFWSSLVVDNYRYDRVAPRPLGVLVRSRGLMELKRFYDQWRIHLSEYMGVGQQYLEKYPTTKEGIQAYQAIVGENGKMAKDPVYGKYHAKYYQVSRKIFDFLLSVAQMSDRYCVARKADSSLFITELSKARHLAYRSGELYSRTCSDPSIKKHLAEQGLTLLGEVGHHNDTVRFSLDVNDLTEPADILGTMPDRLIAMGALTTRSMTPLNSLRKVFPSMLDEPDLRSMILTAMMTRLSYGVGLGAELKRLPGLENLKIEETYFPTFEAETDLLSGLFLQMKMGFIIPGKPHLTRQNLSLFRFRMTEDQRVATAAKKEEKAKVMPIPSGFLIATPDNAVTYQFIEWLEDLAPLEKLPTLEVDEAKLSALVEKILPLLPSKEGEKLTGENVDKLGKVFESTNLKAMPAVTPLIFELFLPMMQARQIILKDPSLNSPTPHAAPAEGAKKSLADGLKELGIDDIKTMDYNFFVAQMMGSPAVTQESLAKRVGKFVANLRYHNRVEQSEITAKRDLIMKLILSE